MPTFTPPVTQGQTQATTGLPYALTAAILMEAAYTFNPLADAGFLVNWTPDAAGSLSPVGRVRDIGGIGWQAEMTTLTETQAIPISSVRAEANEIAVARHGLAFEESQLHKIISGSGPMGDGLDLESIGRTVAWSALRKMRQLMAVNASAIAENAANNSAVMSVDQMEAVRDAMQADGRTIERAIVVLSPKQVADYRASLRAETAMEFPEEFRAHQSITQGAGFVFRDPFGFDVYQSPDVQVVTNVHRGFCFVPGTFHYRFASTSEIASQSGGTDVLAQVAELGLIVERAANPLQAKRLLAANAYFGVDRIRNDVFRHVLVGTTVS